MKRLILISPEPDSLLKYISLCTRPVHFLNWEDKHSEIARHCGPLFKIGRYNAGATVTLLETTKRDNLLITMILIDASFRGDRCLDFN